MLRLPLALSALLALTMATGAAGTPRQAAGGLELNVTISASYVVGRSVCPPGTPASTTECVRFSGSIKIRGLGELEEEYVKTFDETTCPQVTQQRTTSFEVKGKGTFEVAMEGPVCSPPAPASTGPINGTVTGGTGRFAGASGRLQFRSTVGAASPGPSGLTGSSTDTWTGTVAVPGFELDLTPPALRGAQSKAVRVPRKAKQARVRYSVTALDDVDGPVRATCSRTSGSLFKVGRTKVTCTAIDSALNRATTTFTVTVKRR